MIDILRRGKQRTKQRTKQRNTARIYTSPIRSKRRDSEMHMRIRISTESPDKKKRNETKIYMQWIYKRARGEKIQNQARKYTGKGK